MGRRPGRAGAAAPLPIGAQVRILPNHACPTAAQYGQLQAAGTGGEITATWHRFNGW